MFIDNIPFTAAMIPVLVGLQTEGVNVSVIWWALAMGVGMGGNNSHIGSTANVCIVTISERLAKETGNPALAITSSLWIRKGKLVSCSLWYCAVSIFAQPMIISTSRSCICAVSLGGGLHQLLSRIPCQLM